MISKHQQKYLAHYLTKSGGEGINKLSQSLFNANVDLNPHQVEGALFALRSPFNKGVLLADEVGLGKTIEACLVISQYVAEKKDKILIVAPASLRKQWAIELEEKFNLQSQIIDHKSYRVISKLGYINPFMKDNIIIASYHFVARKSQDIRAINWDLVVIDEAHKLRNSHRPSNKIGQALKWALEDKKKILLTATPLQNSLTELYGITSIIDDKIFGDLPTFRTLYANSDGDLNDLKDRILTFCRRTLRKDVLEFIKYTERKLVTIDFNTSDNENQLYRAVSAFLQREDTYAFPKRQKHLIVLIVRKVMASSIYALSETLTTIKNRLISLRNSVPEQEENFLLELLNSADVDEELIEDYDESEDEVSSEINLKVLEEEIEEIEKLILWAKSLGIDSKTKHLIRAIEIGYQEMEKVGASRKAVVFTESKRTMYYLKDYLESNGFLGKICTYSGSNTDDNSKMIFKDWLEKNSDKASQSKAVNIKHAIIDFFQNEGEIMLATEAGSEGLNLQFCSLLINFDLPWNPQRIEQRVGRIHRYGQKHDVVVINFLNKRNAADRRVYDLLRFKFNLFEGIFGSSDGILGKLESSANLEQRITSIYQECRSENEIEKAFNKLQNELEEEISQKLERTKEAIFEHFDEDVHRKLKINYNDALSSLDEYGKKFWLLTKAFLGDNAIFNDEKLTFKLTRSLANIPIKNYYLPNKREVYPKNGERYTLDSDLGKLCISSVKAYQLSEKLIEFDYSNYLAKISVLDSIKGKTGYLLLSKLEIESLEREEHLLFSGLANDGKNIEHETFEKMFKLKSTAKESVRIPAEYVSKLEANNHIFAQAVIRENLEESNKLFQERKDMLHRWSDDVVIAAERNLHNIKKELRLAERQASMCKTMEEQKEAQEKIKELDAKRRAARRRIFDVEDEIEEKRDLLIKELEKRMTQNTNNEKLFMIKWKVI